MKHIKVHLDRMLAGEATLARHATDALLEELRATSTDLRALEALGREVLAAIAADLKSGVRAQKALLLAGGKRRD